jgi:hypothetical protein
VRASSQHETASSAANDLFASGHNDRNSAAPSGFERDLPGVETLRSLGDVAHPGFEYDRN